MKSLLRSARQAVRRRSIQRRADEIGAMFLAPNYVYFDRFGPESVVVDVGCGSEAELSKHLIAAHGVRAFGVDPTRKHAPTLAAVADATGGAFTHLPLAVTSPPGTLTFHESTENESGSVLEGHANVRRDPTRAYEVEAVDLRGLAARVGGGPVALLKLDLEGGEYALLDAVTADALAPFGQVLVEYHPHCIPDRSDADSARLTARIAGFGWTPHPITARDVLFYRP